MLEPKLTRTTFPLALRRLHLRLGYLHTEAILPSTAFIGMMQRRLWIRLPVNGEQAGLTQTFSLYFTKQDAMSTMTPFVNLDALVKDATKHAPSASTRITCTLTCPTTLTRATLGRCKKWRGCVVCLLVAWHRPKIESSKVHDLLFCQVVTSFFLIRKHACPVD